MRHGMVQRLMVQLQWYTVPINQENVGSAKLWIETDSDVVIHNKTNNIFRNEETT